MFKGAHCDAGNPQNKCIIDTACLIQTAAEFPQNVICEHDTPVTNGFSV